MPGEASATWTIDGRELTLTKLDKNYWPASGIDKRDVLGYYRTVAPAMLRYLRGRPLTLVAYTDDGLGRYLRQKPAKAPRWLPSATYQLETRPDVVREEPVVDDAAGLLYYANQEVVEFHLWLSRPPQLDRPDLAVFDLDPGAEAGFERVLETALAARELLSEWGLHAWPKTSGGRGLHLFLPIVPEYEFEATRAWVRGVGERLAAQHPELISAAGGATHHGHLVTVDFAQNSIARSMSAPYTLRASPRALVSTPVSWAEVEAGKVRPADFTIATIPQRLKDVGDPWEALPEQRQQLPLKS